VSSYQKESPLKKEWEPVVSKSGVCLLALAVLLSPAFCQRPATDTQLADEQDICAVVIRHQMEEWVREGEKNAAEAKTEDDKAIAQRLNFEIFFVSIEGKDPSDDFISRFRDIPRTIKKASSEEPGKGPHTPVDKSTHHTGIVFSVDSIQWLGKDSTKVEGGYYCGGLCAAGITFRVKRENGKWIIKNSGMNWIS
jgi:hypothetical protein